VNITNRYLDLRPVIERAASYFDRMALDFEFDPEEDETVCFGASWVLVMKQSTREVLSAALQSGEVLPSQPGFPIWTDDFSNMFRILK